MGTGQVLVVLMEWPADPALLRLAQDDGWRILRVPRTEEVFRSVRNGGHIIIVQVGTGVSEAKAISLVERLKEYWVKVVVIAALTRWRTDLEQSLRTAGALCCVAESTDLEPLRSMADGQRCRLGARFSRLSSTMEGGDGPGARRRPRASLPLGVHISRVNCESGSRTFREERS